MLSFQSSIDVTAEASNIQQKSDNINREAENSMLPNILRA